MMENKSVKSSASPAAAINKALEMHIADDDPNIPNISKSGRSDDDQLKGNKVTKVVLLNTTSSCSPAEAVFSIDHVLESIFMKLRKKTLLKCRLVSPRWAYFGSKELQKTVNIKFSSDWYDKNGPIVFALGRPFQERSVQDLINVMNNSQEFPCTSFFLSSRGVGRANRTAQQLLSAHGPLIKKLKLDGDLSFDDLEQLLLTQAPNLQQLSLSDKSVLFGSDERNTRNWSASRSDETIPATERPIPILKNLKVFKCYGFKNFSTACIQQILEYSPNLVEVVIPNETLHCLVHPLNRLHLLKKLKIDIATSNVESFEAVAHHCHDGNLKLETLHFMSCEHFHDDDEDTKLYLRAKNIMAKICLGASATCQKLVWEEILEDFQIPQMPQVQHFNFMFYEEHPTKLPVSIFPRGRATLRETFPSLKSFNIRTGGDSMKKVRIQNIFGGQCDPVPFRNVANIYLDFKPTEKQRRSFRAMFPNANIGNEDEIGWESDDDESCEEYESDDEDSLYDESDEDEYEESDDE